MDAECVIVVIMLVDKGSVVSVMHLLQVTHLPIPPPTQLQLLIVVLLFSRIQSHFFHRLDRSLSVRQINLGSSCLVQ